MSMKKLLGFVIALVLLPVLVRAGAIHDALEKITLAEMTQPLPQPLVHVNGQGQLRPFQV